MTDSTTLYCYIHPTRPTLLRCNHCERPICMSCAIRTPTGYRCKECVRGQQRAFETAVWSDYVIAFFTGAILSGIASVLVLFISSFIWFLAIILAPLAGASIGTMARRLIKGRHSRWLNLLFGASLVIGALPMLLVLGLGGVLLMTGASQNGQGLSNIFSLSPMLWQVVYLVIATPAAYSQFSGLSFKR